MATEEKAPKETAQTFTVIANGGVTTDKHYSRGSKIELTDKKQIKVLTTNKLIK